MHVMQRLSGQTKMCLGFAVFFILGGAYYAVTNPDVETLGICAGGTLSSLILARAFSL
ncbi:MAG: hypothetical protein G01um101429_1124 [Parcubacteria group bacterium Gr01-1014_29]|nr:MAG: hypothetical protein G01um101429_1124 [Parcubacteria group bacterium Gr01-1014_29]